MNQETVNNSGIEQNNRKKFWIGLGVGLGIGAIGGSIGGYCYAAKKERKRARDEIRRSRRHYYEKGRHDMQEYGRKSCEALFIDHPELAKAFEESMMGGDQENDVENDGKKANVEVTTVGAEELNDAWRGYRENGDNLEFITEDGGMIVAPRRLFFDKKGEPVGASQIRVNLREYFRMDQKTLAKLWRIIGYGNYEPDVGNMGAYVDSVSSEEVDEMETIADGLDIDDIDDAGTEERLGERSVYMDQLERYKQHPEEGFRICSEREFNESTRLDQRQVDYYDVDNVFVYNDDLATVLDSWELFGVGNGNDLFGKIKFDPDEDDNDPDIVRGINFKHNLAVEITRYHKSYAGVQDGSAYI